MNEIEKQIVDIINEYFEAEKEINKTLMPWIGKFCKLQEALKDKDLDVGDSLAMDAMNKVCGAYVLGREISEIFHQIVQLDPVESRSRMNCARELHKEIIDKLPQTFKNFEFAINEMELVKHEVTDEN